jgi:hypothetical protein
LLKGLKGDSASSCLQGQLDPNVKMFAVLYYNYIFQILCADSWGTFSRNRANLHFGNWIQTSTVMLGGMDKQMWMKMEG